MYYCGRRMAVQVEYEDEEDEDVSRDMKNDLFHLLLHQCFTSRHFLMPY